MEEEFRSLYDRHPDYVERRDPESFAAREIQLEARAFKVPNLLLALPDSADYSLVAEIGCATGEVLAAFPDRHPSLGHPIRKIGFDISPLNVAAATARYPDIQFLSENFADSGVTADVVVLSDLLEHVPDDAGLLRDAGKMARFVLINLPLEDNWLNRNRDYGIDDESGHLRAYSLSDGFELVARAGLKVEKWHRVWAHETEYDLSRRTLRRELTGSSHSGSLLVAAAKTLIYHSARGIKPFGRRLFPSNLFLCARR